MINFKTLLNIVFITTTLLFISCNIGYEINGNNQIKVQDLATAFDESKTRGQTISIVQTEKSEVLSFSITSKIPTGVLSINPSTYRAYSFRFFEELGETSLKSNTLNFSGISAF